MSQRKIDPHIEARGHTTTTLPSPPAASAPAAPALVADTRRYLGPAQWLYLARLPSPHDTRPWCASHTPLSSLFDYLSYLVPYLESDPSLSDPYLIRCSWYLSCLIARQGWTLLTARTDTTKVMCVATSPTPLPLLRCSSHGPHRHHQAAGRPPLPRLRPGTALPPPTHP